VKGFHRVEELRERIEAVSHSAGSQEEALLDVGA
jgi:hypothetical protein